MSVDLEGELVRQRNRTVELKADLHDVDAQVVALERRREDLARDLDDTSLVIATLEALQDAAAPAALPAAPVQTRRAREA